MRHVETAKEWVDAEGRIHGIGSVTNVSSSLAVGAWRLLVVAPGVGVSVWATKLIFAPAPDAEIAFARGTEYRLELTRPLQIDDADDFSGPPTSLLSPEIRTDTRAAIIRSNFLSLAYNGVRLSSATRRFLFGKPVPDDTGETLTRQQVEWLAEKSRLTCSTSATDRSSILGKLLQMSSTKI